MRTFVVELLKNNLPSTYRYHCLEHTLYVADKVLEIGKEENCSEKELDLLVAAALWHDSGFTSVYNNHEEEGCRLAKKHLPNFGYSPSDIEIICGMIMATKIPQTPKNRLEEIISDADLEYLGTDHAIKEATFLYEELLSFNPNLTKEEWNKIQISFLQKHHYFTNYCKEKKDPLKLIYLNSLLKQL